MVLLLESGKKNSFRTFVDSQDAIDQLIELQYTISEFNEKNYYKVGLSNTYEKGSKYLDQVSYSRYFDFCYKPISDEKVLYSDTYKVTREAYKSHYQLVLRLISSILNNDSKMIDLTHVIGNYISIDDLVKRRDALHEKILNIGSLSEKEKEALKRKYNEYSYIVKCLSLVQLERTNQNVKERTKIKKYDQAA